MAKYTAYNAIGSGTESFLSNSGLFPSLNITDTYSNFYGVNNLKIRYEIDGGDYSITAELVALTESKFKLTSIILENSVPQDLIAISELTIKLDINELQSTDVFSFGEAAWSTSDTIIGTDFADALYSWGGDDIVHGNGGQDWLKGGSGNDFLYGGQDGDILNGGDGNDSLFGGDGDDTGFGGHGKDRIFGGEGNDQLLGGKGSDKIFGGNGADELQGCFGNDYMVGGSGNDHLRGGDGNDTLIGGDGSNTLRGAQGKDELNGAAGNDDLFGGGSKDMLKGNSGDDFISGGSGRDVILGGSGNDTITGGLGRDDMTGGIGEDTFALNSANESGTGSTLRDIVRDFTLGEDVFDFSAIDAGNEPSDQMFVFIGTSSFSESEGELRYSKNLINKTTIISGDVDGDSESDFQIELRGIMDLSHSDLIL